MSGLLCLKWNNHGTAFYKTLNNHRSKELYCDTTIACRGKYYPVHRLVLTTCSEYFEEIFERTQCKHPFIIIKDIQPTELEALLNYMYKGEVNVLQDMLPGLIKAAESLKIRGLAVPDDGESSGETKEKKRSRTSSPPPYVKKSRKVMKKAIRSNDSRLSVSPSPIEVEPDIISIEPQTSITEEPSETPVATSNNNKFISNKSGCKQVSSLYDQDSSSSNYKQNDSSLIRSKSKGNGEELRDDDDDDDDDDEDDDNIDLEDVKVEALELVPMEDMDENQYPLSETEVDSKTESEGSLFRTLLGGDDTATSKNKLKNSNGNENHPMAQCSTWDDNLEHSNDGSHLNSDEMQDEMVRRQQRNHKTKTDYCALAFDFPAQAKQSESPSSTAQDNDWWVQNYVKKCPHCSYTSKYKSNLTTHILRKHTQHAFSCNECDYRCATNQALKIHTRKHTGEKPYSCNLCPYQAKYYDSIKKHTMVHSGEKPFKCILCRYETTQHHTLNKHMRMYHSTERETVAAPSSDSTANVTSIP